MRNSNGFGANWAQAVAEQTADAELQATFAPIAEALTANEATIVNELNSAQGQPADINGYYFADTALAAKAMRPSATFNAILAQLS